MPDQSQFNIARTCPMFKYGGQLEVRQIAELQCD